MVVPNFAGGEGLRISRDTNSGLTNAAWLTLLTTATDKDDSFAGSGVPDFTGAKRAVSYRIAYQNPIAPGRGTDQSYALYRSIASARHTFENIGLKVTNMVTNTVTNMQTQYWASIPTTPAPAPLDTTAADALLAENIVALQVRFEYLDASGNAVWTAPGDEIRIGRDGSTVNGTPVPGGFRRAEVGVTTLTTEGAQRVRDGVMDVEKAVEMFGKRSVRETSRF